MKNLYDHTAEEIKAMKKAYIVTHTKSGCQGKSAYLNLITNDSQLALEAAQA